MIADWFSTLSRAHWESPWAFALLPALVVLWLVVRRLSRNAAAPVLSTTQGLDALPRTLRQRIVWLPAALSWAGLALLCIALARPQIGIGRVETSSDAVAIQLVVDRSGSMNQFMELDGAMISRADAVKRVLREFLLGDGRELRGRTSDFVGLVVFARFAETTCPLVRDARTVSQFVDAISSAQMRFDDGTAIGDGLALAAARLKRAEDELNNRRRASSASGGDLRIKSKVIVLLTDGDNNAGEADPLAAAQLAAEWGIRVYTIGLGAGTTSYQVLRTPLGEQRVPIQNTMDERVLKQIAEMTGGLYHRAQDGEALRRVYAEIDRLEKSTIRTVEYTDWQEKFHLVAVPGAAVLLLGVLLSVTVLRRTS